MKEEKQGNKIFCIFDLNKDEINLSIGRAFEAYLQELIKEK